MKFYDRTSEIELLQDIRRQSLNNAQFTVLTGRRRIGKTALVLHAYSDTPLVYFFVARKTERELCVDFAEQLQEALKIPMLGVAESFAKLFEYIMRLSETTPLTLFIDEFQDFMLVNPSVFSEMQRIWDLNKDKARINLVCAGSVNSMMNKIFRDAKEPLYGRETHSIRLRPFETSVLKDILKDCNPSYTNEDLLAFWSFTGGVAKYIELFVNAGALTFDRMVDFMLSPGSVFLEEGKITLVGEFGKEYGTYFSILSAIACGKTSRAQIEDSVGREVGGYLTRLEKDYELIAKRQPIFEKTGNKNVRYVLNDNFLTYWFRLVFKYNYMIESNALRQLGMIVRRDYPVFSGFMLERYFRAKYAETGDYTRIGSWWDRRGENEIDLVAVNELDDKLVIAEIKRNRDKINPRIIQDKLNTFLSAVLSLKGYSLQIKALSLDDM